MRVVILASGQSTRFWPLQNKMLLPFCGQPLITWQIQQLANHGTSELYIICGEHNEAVLKAESENWPIKPEKWIKQTEFNTGMADAIAALAQEYQDDKPFLLVSSNDIISDNGFQQIQQQITKNPQQSFLLAKEVEKYFPGGYLELNSDGSIKQIIEKPGDGNQPSNLVNLVYHYHANPQNFFQAIQQNNTENSAVSGGDQYEQALQQQFESASAYQALSYHGPWQTLKYPWHVIDMTNQLFERTEQQIHPDAEVAASATIKGAVHIEQGAKIMENAVISGPAYIGANTIVATGSLVRGSYIGPNCVIGYNSEVARSYLHSHVWLHTNYIGDSIIGSNVSFGAGTKTGNYRLDEQEISTSVKGEQNNTERTKLGLITGNDIRVGINTSFMPGVKVGRNSMIGANLLVAEDIPDNSFVTAEQKPELKIRDNNANIPKRS